MNEVQGPTPTGTSRPYRSLAEALRAHRIPAENHEFIGAVTDAIGISSFIDRGRYIEAIRRVPAAPLHIGRTYINGFSEDEQVVVAGRVLPLLPSEGRAPYFYVTQPSGLPVVRPLKKAAGSRASGAAKPAAQPAAHRPTKATNLAERDYGVCDVCFMVKNAAGKCGCDE